jgi:hypothetical protein
VGYQPVLCILKYNSLIDLSFLRRQESTYQRPWMPVFTGMTRLPSFIVNRIQRIICISMKFIHMWGQGVMRTI